MPQRPPAALTHRRKIQPEGKQNHQNRWESNPTRFFYKLVTIPSKIPPHIQSCVPIHRSSTVAGSMGAIGPKKITGKSNTDADDKNDDILVDVETHEDMTNKHHMCLRQHQDSPRTQSILEKLWKGQKFTDEIFTSKKFNPKLSKTTLIKEDIYTTHRIHRSPSTLATKRPPTARKSGEPGGESRNRRRGASVDCWGADASRGRACAPLARRLGLGLLAVSSDKNIVVSTLFSRLHSGLLSSHLNIH